ncbi:hypothetical protein DAEQUDRAFT_500686 [Daedalea quercina L-15889]|uniref:F-box domain-containing protein n=1 Tax=Daedalea quercina L-15889 TaxID=1314783 RepID=A0A165T697_9APHY|nr:hypothetical protein DAEQUDRAFT_500686 [Daedalea quercina L-15889]
MTAPSNEILKLLDGPAPLLESLSTFESAYGSKLRLTASRLLSRPESSRLRRLELTKCSLVWDSISLKSLTQLTLDGCGNGMKLVHVLGALSRMPQLEKLVTKGAFESLIRNASTQSSRTPIYLPRLRSIRSTGDSPANCAGLLQNLYTPSLSYLYVGLGYEGTVSSESRGNRLLELVLAVATKAGSLGRFLTLAITLPASFNTSVCLYRDSCETTVGAKDDSTMSWIDKHNPALELHIPFAMGDGLWSAFCGQFPINSVSCLILHQYLPPMSMWLDLMRRVKLVTELRVYCARLLHSLPETLARLGHPQ